MTITQTQVAQSPLVSARKALSIAVGYHKLAETAGPGWRLKSTYADVDHVRNLLSQPRIFYASTQSLCSWVR